MKENVQIGAGGTCLMLECYNLLLTFRNILLKIHENKGRVAVVFSLVVLHVYSNPSLRGAAKIFPLTNLGFCPNQGGV